MSVSHVRSVSCVLRSKSRGIQASLVGSLSGSSSEDHIQAGIATFPASCIILTRALAVNCHFLLDISFVASIGCSVSSATCAAHFIGEEFFGVVVTAPVCISSIIKAVIIVVIGKKLSVGVNVCIETETCSLLPCSCTSATRAAH